jgi:hypothetical protein
LMSGAGHAGSARPRRTRLNGGLSCPM